ncbi:MAG: hypothetical protein LBD59_11770 [Prevotellaceae bacterium]|nr:hypothetical protein [Prevotellaceae bacterium]
MSVRKLEYTQSPSRRDGMLVENTSPTAQSPSRQGRNVKFVDLKCSPVVRTRLCLVRFILVGCACQQRCKCRHSLRR